MVCPALCALQGTVGAGLPIISTLKTILDTGDEVVRIEGVFRYGWASCQLWLAAGQYLPVDFPAMLLWHATPQLSERRWLSHALHNWHAATQ